MDALLTGAVRSKGTLARTEAGDAATAAQLLRLEPSSLLIVEGLIPDIAPWALRADRCWRSPPPFLWPSVAFFATLDIALANEALDGLLTPDACAAHAAAFFGLPGGPNLVILEDGGPPGETGRDVAPDG